MPDCLSSSVLVLTDHLRLPESREGKRHRTELTGRASRPIPFCLSKLLMGLLQATGYTSSPVVTTQCHTSDLCEYWTQGIDNKIMIIFNSKSGVTTKEGDDVKVEDFVVTVCKWCVTITKISIHEYQSRKQALKTM